MIKKTLISIAFLLITNFIQAQNNEIIREKFFTTSIGGTWQARKDNLFSPLTYEGIGGEMHIGSERISERWFKQFDMWGSYNKARSYVTKGYNYSAHIFRGGLSYAAMHRILPDNKLCQLFVGGSVFSNGNGQYYLGNVNNSLSYDFPSGIAAGAFVQKNFRLFRRNWVASSQLSLPLVAYNLRPTFIGFSNEDFLTTQTGFVAIPKLFQLDWRWSVEYPLSNNNKLRLTYRWEYLDDKQNGRLQLGTQTLLVQSLFNFPFKQVVKN